MREAIKAANDDVSVDGSTAGSGNDVIVFDPSLNGSTINVNPNRDPFEITEDVRVSGNGSSNTVIDGNASDVFVLPDREVTFDVEGLRITDVAIGIEAQRSYSRVTMKSVIIDGSVLGVDAGSSRTRVFVERSRFNNNERGIRVRNVRELSVQDTTFADNVTTGNGAGILVRTAGTREPVIVTVDGATFQDNQAGQHGGAIKLILTDLLRQFEDPDVQILRSTFSGNSAEEGGAIRARLADPDSSSAFDIEDSTFFGNTGDSAISVNGEIYLGLTNSIVAGDAPKDIAFQQGFFWWRYSGRTQSR